MKTLSKSVADLTTRIRNQCELATEVTADSLTSDFRQVTARWQHKPKFARVRVRNKTMLSITVEPDGENAQIFSWVDLGTKGPYPIPKFGPIEEGKRLFFRGGYSAFTAPVARYNVGTGTASGPLISKERVMHPGVKSRKFSKVFAEDILQELVRNIREAIRRAAGR